MTGRGRIRRRGGGEGPSGVSIIRREGRRGWRGFRSVFLSGLLVFAGPSTMAAQAILNVERLQQGEVEGLHGEVTGRLTLSGGNTDLLQVGIQAGGGFRTLHHWPRAFLGMERLRKNDEEILDNRYLHVRYNYIFGDRFRSFHFYQLQTNQNLLLRRRWLLGSGLRGRALGGNDGNLEVGSGLMYEAETLQQSALEPGEDPDTRTVRMANLLVASWDPREGARVVAVAYYQPDIQRFMDYRLVGEAGLAVEIVGGISLDVTLNWRHDSRAPATLVQDDVSLKTGLTYRLQ